MPQRQHIFGSGLYYHVFNRSLFSRPVFSNGTDAALFIDTCFYYLQSSPPMRFSFFRKTKPQPIISKKDRLVSLISYCVMPNHFHLTLRQEKDDGISTFIRRVTSSYVHYFQKKYQQRGPLFESAFKAVPVETDEQLIHLSRYHHLNPVTAYLVDNPAKYPYSSYRFYLGEKSENVDPSPVVTNFTSPGSYVEFVLDRVSYQRELARIRHLLLER